MRERIFETRAHRQQHRTGGHGTVERQHRTGRQPVAQSRGAGLLPAGARANRELALEDNARVCFRVSGLCASGVAIAERVSQKRCTGDGEFGRKDREEQRRRAEGPGTARPEWSEREREREREGGGGDV